MFEESFSSVHIINTLWTILYWYHKWRIPSKSQAVYNIKINPVHPLSFTTWIVSSKIFTFSDGSTSDISASVIQAIPFQARNYYKSVSENKEIVKLVSVLSTSISSTKKVHKYMFVCIVHYKSTKSNNCNFHFLYTVLSYPKFSCSTSPISYLSPVLCCCTGSDDCSGPF